MICSPSSSLNMSFPPCTCCKLIRVTGKYTMLRTVQPSLPSLLVKVSSGSLEKAIQTTIFSPKPSHRLARQSWFKRIRRRRSSSSLKLRQRYRRVSAVSIHLSPSITKTWSKPTISNQSQPSARCKLIRSAQRMWRSAKTITGRRACTVCDWSILFSRLDCTSQLMKGQT